MKYITKHFFGGRGKLTEREYHKLLALEYVITQGYYKQENYNDLIDRYNYLSSLAHTKASLLELILLFIKNAPLYPAMIQDYLYMRIIYPYKYPDRCGKKRLVSYLLIKFGIYKPGYSKK